MAKRDYSVSVENGMRVRHDANARLLIKTGKEVLEDRFVSAENLGGAFTTASVMYNRASYSGGVSWWNPATGRTITRPKIMIFFRPEDILTGDEECNCDRCVAA